ncbi:nucleotide-diphospho-sugar transferase [Shewanella baltica]|uniref:nucleotide-diphospho-sugar transferase n=1 Tax=Shewanella baltica TaxID=62322 RepID=UPI000D378FE9|nr:nucleotide-diphospho-sugar transferase [Shewanella baltica]
MGFDVPILILIFNRRDGIDKLIESIRLVKPKRLFIASDGPRDYIENEDFLVHDIRQYVLSIIDWDCEINTLFREQNLGCKLGVSSAVKWFFSHVKKGIVLEDDCIPSSSFYDYCRVLLNKYELDYRIGSISGRNELSVYGDQPIIFSSKFICWGWASWADRISKLDVEYGYNESDVINFNSCSLVEKLHIKSLRGAMLTRQVNSWAFPFDFGFRKNEQLCIIPKFNMISNIGFGVSGTHSSSRASDDVKVFSESALSLSSNSLNVLTNKYFVNKLILSLYSWPKLLVLSNIRLLYPMRPMYRKLRRLLTKD